MVNFFEDYTRKDKKDEVEEMVESKIDEAEQKKQDRARKETGQSDLNTTNYAEVTSANVRDFLNEKDACLIYFTTLPAGKPVKEEFKHFNKMSR